MDSPIPPVAATQPLPPVLPPAEKNQNWLKILLIIIGVLVVLGLFANLYLLALNQKPAAETSPIPTQIAITPTPDATTGWKTYTNEKYQFETKYNPDFNPVEEAGTKELSGNFIYLLTTRFALGLNLLKSPYGYLVEVNNQKSLSDYRTQIVGHVADKIDSEETAAINGNLWTKIVYKIFLTTDYVLVVKAVINHGGYGYAVAASAGDIDVILSTFKFLDQNQADLTTSWKTFQSSDITFKYPAGWTKSGDFALISADPKIRLVVIPKGNTLMNECMMKTSVETKGNLTIKKFSRVTTGAMCGTSDSTPREIWVIPSPDAYAPGISYEYLSTQGTQAESIFDQILSTFKFLQ